MIDTTLDDATAALVAKAAAIASDVVAPEAGRADREGSFRPTYLAELGDAGLMGLGLPVEHGGDGHDAVTVGLVLEQLAAVDITTCWPVLNAALIGGILSRSASPEQAAAWLPDVAQGRAVVALCLTEPEHGTDAGAIELAAVPDDDGGWRLTGTKTSIMVGDLATHGLVFARTGGSGPRGISAFYLDLAAPGIARERLSDMGNRAGGRATITFDGVEAGKEQLVGGLGEGFVGVMRGFDYSRALIGLMATGAAAACLEVALDAARHRTSFGVPLGRHQGVSFPLVDHTARIRAGRLLAVEALARKDAGLDHRVEANLVKAWVPTAAVDAAHAALIALGHRGWSTDCIVERHVRDLIGTQIADGTVNATRLVVARQLLGRDAAP